MVAKRSRQTPRRSKSGKKRTRKVGGSKKKKRKSKRGIKRCSTLLKDSGKSSGYTLTRCINGVYMELNNFKTTVTNRTMLQQALPLALHELSSERHNHQQAVLNCIDEALRDIDHGLGADITDHQQQLQEISQKSFALREQIHTYESVEAQKAEDLAVAKEDVAEARASLKNSQKLEEQQKKNLQVAKHHLDKRQRDLDHVLSIVNDDFLPLVRGDTGSSKHVKSFMELITKIAKSDDALTRVLPMALAKKPEKRGNFDSIALTYATNTTEQHKSGLQARVQEAHSHFEQCQHNSDIAVDERQSCEETLNEAESRVKTNTEDMNEAKNNAKNSFVEANTADKQWLAVDKVTKSIQKRQVNFRTLVAAFRVFVERDVDEPSERVQDDELFLDETEETEETKTQTATIDDEDTEFIQYDQQVPAFA